MQYDWLLRGGSRAEAEARDTSFLRFYQMPARPSSRMPVESPFLPSPFTTRSNSQDKRKLSRLQLKDKIKLFTEMLSDPSVERLPDKGERLRRKKAEYELQLQQLERLGVQQPTQRAHQGKHQRQEHLLKQAGNMSPPLGMLTSETVTIKESRAPGQQPRNRKQWRQPQTETPDDDDHDDHDEGKESGDGGGAGAVFDSEQQRRTAGEDTVTEAADQSSTEEKGAARPPASSPSSSQGKADTPMHVPSRCDATMLLDSDAVLQMSDDELEELLVARMCGMSVGTDTATSEPVSLHDAPEPPKSRSGTHEQASAREGGSESSRDSNQNTDIRPPMESAVPTLQQQHQARWQERDRQEQKQKQKTDKEHQQHRGQAHRTPGLAVRERDVRWRPSEPPKPGQTRELSLTQLVRLQTRVEQERREARLQALMRGDV